MSKSEHTRYQGHHERAKLLRHAHEAPHFCTVPDCPGNLNRERLELLDKMVDLLPDIQRLAKEVTTTGLPGLQEILSGWLSRYRELGGGE